MFRVNVENVVIPNSNAVNLPVAHVLNPTHRNVDFEAVLLLGLPHVSSIKHLNQLDSSKFIIVQRPSMLVWFGIQVKR